MCVFIIDCTLIICIFQTDDKERYETEMAKWKAEGGKKSSAKKQKKTKPKSRASRKKFKPIETDQQLRILQHVRNNYNALYDGFSNGRPKNSNINAWNEAYDFAIRYVIYLVH